MVWCNIVDHSVSYDHIIPVSVKNTPPGKKTLWKTGFQSTKSCAGEQLFLLCYMAGARVKGLFLFTDTGIII